MLNNYFIYIKKSLKEIIKTIYTYKNFLSKNILIYLIKNKLKI